MGFFFLLPSFFKHTTITPNFLKTDNHYLHFCTLIGMLLVKSILEKHANLPFKR